jgi:hypothetical protein
MKSRWSLPWLLFTAIVLSLLSALLLVSGAQAAPEVETPGVAVADGNSWTKWVTDGVVAGIRQSLETWLQNSGVVTLIRSFFAGLGTMALSYLSQTEGVGSGCDIMNQLSADCVLQNEVVSGVMTRSAQLFNVLVGTGLVFLGFNVLWQFGGEAGRELGMLFPRLVIALFAVNQAADLLRWVSAAAREAGHFLAGGNQSLAGVFRDNLSPEEAGGTLVLLVGITALLVIQRIMMHGLLAVLAMSACLAFAAGVIPAWQQWFWRWATLLTGLVVGAYVQTLLMHAGASMLSRAIADSSDGSRAATAGLWGMATIATAISAPALVGGGVSFGGSAYGLIRRATRPVRLRAKRGRGGDDRDDGPKATAEEQFRKERPETITYTALPPAPTAALPPPPAESEYTSFEKH